MMNVRERIERTMKLTDELHDMLQDEDLLVLWGVLGMIMAILNRRGSLSDDLLNEIMDSIRSQMDKDVDGLINGLVKH